MTLFYDVGITVEAPGGAVKQVPGGCPASGRAPGYAELVGGKFRRNRSTTHLVIGVMADASGKGVGTGLLAEAKRWAAARGLRRIELNVMAHNHRAIAPYERAGFVHEGRRVDCLLIDGKFSTSAMWLWSCHRRAGP